MKKRIAILFIALALILLPMVDVFAYEEIDNEINIRDEGDFIQFAQDIAFNDNRFSGKVIHIKNDLDLSEYNWYDIMSVNRKFNGIIDGEGHTISGLNYSQDKEITTDRFGLLGGRINSGSTVGNESYDGACAGVFNLCIEGSMEILGEYTGALFGCIDKNSGKVVFKNVQVDVDISGGSSSTYIGGLVGYNDNEDTVIENCTVSGSLSSSVSGDVMLGGFVGLNGATKTSAASLAINNSLFCGSINTTGGGVGAFVGVNGNGKTTNKATLSGANCVCIGDLSCAANAKTDVGTDNNNNASLGVAVPSTSMEYLQNTSFENGYCNLRFVAILNDGTQGKSLEYFSTVGFEIFMTVTDNGKQWTNKIDGKAPTIKSVHTSIIAENKPYTADDLGGDYIFVASMSGIKQNVGVLSFEVRTFFDNSAGVRVYSETKTYTFDTDSGEWGGAE